MKDYQAVDLSKAYNVTADIYKNETEPPVGNQVFHGLPFKIGSGLPDTKTFIVLGPRSNVLLIQLQSILILPQLM